MTKKMMNVFHRFKRLNAITVSFLHGKSSQSIILVYFEHMYLRAKKQSRKLLGTQNLENIMNRNVHSNY